jgi:hypothetical protein
MRGMLFGSRDLLASSGSVTTLSAPLAQLSVGSREAAASKTAKNAICPFVARKNWRYGRTPRRCSCRVH